MYDVSTGQNQQVAAHDAPIKCIAYIDMPNGSGQNGVLVTAGWDKKLKVSTLYVSRENRLMGSTGIVEGQRLSCRSIYRKGHMRWTLRINYWYASYECTGAGTDDQVVGTADRKIHVVDLNTPGSIYRVRGLFWSTTAKADIQTIDSPLKWQTRSIACFPSGDAYAVGSIEGRVAIQ
jgi:mRNA export factor